MTPKQDAFVREYLIDLNATQAAIRAGYSVRTAEQAGSRLLSDVKISVAHKEAMDARAARVELSADRVLRELMLMGFANMLDYLTPHEDGTASVDLSKLTRDQAAARTALLSDVGNAIGRKNFFE